MLECITDATIEYAGYTPVRDARGENGSLFSPLRQDVLENIAGLSDDRVGSRPIYAGIGNRATIFQLGKIVGDRLVAAFDVALDHQPDDRLVAFADLVHAVRHHERLHVVILEGIGVGAVDDDV